MFPFSQFLSLYLLADYAEQPWPGVVTAWVTATRPLLCLTDQPEAAAGYLLVGRRLGKLLNAVREQFHNLCLDTPVYWLNDATGLVTTTATLLSFLETLDPRAYAAACPACGAQHALCRQCGRQRVHCDGQELYAWCEACEADYLAAMAEWDEPPPDLAEEIPLEE